MSSVTPTNFVKMPLPTGSAYTGSYQTSSTSHQTGYQVAPATYQTSYSATTGPTTYTTQTHSEHTVKSSPAAALLAGQASVVGASALSSSKASTGTRYVSGTGVTATGGFSGMAGVSASASRAYQSSTYQTGGSKTASSGSYMQQIKQAYPGGVATVPTHSTGHAHSASVTYAPSATRATSLTTGQQIVHTSERVDLSQQRVIAERVIEHEVKVPKKVTREDYVERVIVVPEKIVHEEFTEDIQKIRERIVEVAAPVIQEKIVEVPEIEYVDKIVEYPEIVLQEKIREVPRIEIQERIIEVPKIIYQDKIVEVPEIEYRDVPVEKIIEVPEVREQVVLKEIAVPQYIEKPVPEYVDVTQEVEISRNVPVTVEALTTVEFKLPRLRAQQRAVDVPLYVPRFVEVAIPADSMDAATIAQAEAYANQVATLAMSSAVSLCDVENLAGALRQMDFERAINTTDRVAVITDAFHTGRLQVDQASMAYAASSTESHTTYTHVAPMATSITKGSTVVSGPQLTGSSHIVERSSVPVTSTTEVTTVTNRSKPTVYSGTSYATQQVSSLGGAGQFLSGQLYEAARVSAPIRAQLATSGSTVHTGGYTTGTTISTGSTGYTTAYTPGVIGYTSGPTGTFVGSSSLVEGVQGSTTTTLVSSKGTVVPATPMVNQAWQTTAVLANAAAPVQATDAATANTSETELAAGAEASSAQVTTEKVTTTTTTTTTTPSPAADETVSATPSTSEAPADDSINTSGVTVNEDTAN